MLLCIIFPLFPDGSKVILLELHTISPEGLGIHVIGNQLLLLDVTLVPGLGLRDFLEHAGPVGDCFSAHGLRSYDGSPVGNLDVLVSELTEGGSGIQVAGEAAGGKSQDRLDLAGFDILGSSRRLGDQEIEVSTQDGGDGTAGCVVGDVGELVLGYADFLDQGSVASDVVTLGTTKHDSLASLEGSQYFLKALVLGVLTDEKQVLVNSHVSDGLEVLKAVGGVLQHRHEVAAVEGEQGVVGLYTGLDLGNQEAAYLTGTVGLVLDNNVLAVEQVLVHLRYP